MMYDSCKEHTQNNSWPPAHDQHLCTRGREQIPGKEQAAETELSGLQSVTQAVKISTPRGSTENQVHPTEARLKTTVRLPSENQEEDGDALLRRD